MLKISLFSGPDGDVHLLFFAALHSLTLPGVQYPFPLTGLTWRSDLRYTGIEPACFSPRTPVLQPLACLSPYLHLLKVMSVVDSNYSGSASGSAEWSSVASLWTFWLNPKTQFKKISSLTITFKGDTEKKQYHIKAVKEKTNKHIRVWTILKRDDKMWY